MTNIGHIYFRLGRRNVAIIYRHSIWKAPDLLTFEGSSESVSIEPLNIDSILFHSDFDLKLIKTHIESNPTLVWGVMARIGDRVVGFCTVYLKGSKASQYRIEKCDAYIDTVCVDNEFRGRGIAPIILSNVITQVRNQGGNEILLAVRENNLSMLNAIKKIGFQYVRQSISVRFLGKRVIYPVL